jgi:transposase
MQNQIFEAALGLATPWFVQDVAFDVERKTLEIRINFVTGSRFAYPGVDGTHPVHDTQSKRYRHLNFFQHECYLEVRVPRLRLPDGRVLLLEPEWAGHLSGFTLLF